MGKEISYPTSLLTDLSSEYHFTRRGKAFFRVVGDGVLQTIKAGYEIHGSFYELSIGLDSMYSPLKADWLTSFGCIPAYNISNLIGKDSAKSVYLTSDRVLMSNLISIEEQVQLLWDKGIPWLDGILTQRKLADAMCQLESDVSKIYWNDSRKLGAFLACKDYGHAEYAIFRILHQHQSATGGGWVEPPWTEEIRRAFCQKFSVEEDDPIFRCFRPWTEEEYTLFRNKYARERNRDDYFLMLHDWIQNKDEAAIDRYLQKNYETNCVLTRFIK